MRHCFGLLTGGSVCFWKVNGAPFPPRHRVAESGIPFGLVVATMCFPCDDTEDSSALGTASRGDTSTPAGNR